MEVGSHEERGGKGVATAAAAFMCRPSSSRWIPTAEQVKILRDLYYNAGLRSPTTEQIQRITAKLRQFGKIEGKNVFYWFQDHKARERQKKRIINELSNPNSIGYAKNCMANKLASGGSTLYSVEQLETSGYGGGSCALIEKSFGEGFVVGDHQVQCMELLQDPATSPWMTVNRSSTYHHEHISSPFKQMETLQLFPIHSKYDHINEELYEEIQHEELKDRQEIVNNSLYHSADTTSSSHYVHHIFYGNHHDHGAAGAGAASLELTLNSLYCAPPGST